MRRQTACVLGSQQPSAVLLIGYLLIDSEIREWINKRINKNKTVKTMNISLTLWPKCSLNVTKQQLDLKHNVSFGLKNERNKSWELFCKSKLAKTVQGIPQSLTFFITSHFRILYHRSGSHKIPLDTLTKGTRPVQLTSSQLDGDLLSVSSQEPIGSRESVVSNSLTRDWIILNLAELEQLLVSLCPEDHFPKDFWRHWNWERWGVHVFVSSDACVFRSSRWRQKEMNAAKSTSQKVVNKEAKERFACKHVIQKNNSQTHIIPHNIDCQNIITGQPVCWINVAWTAAIVHQCLLLHQLPWGPLASVAVWGCVGLLSWLHTHVGGAARTPTVGSHWLRQY